MDQRQIDFDFELAKLILEEYKALRAEILAKQSKATNYFNANLAFIGVIIALAISSQNIFILFLVLSLIIPSICIINIKILDEDHRRIQFIGGYLQSIENRINQKMCIYNQWDYILLWENVLREDEYKERLTNIENINSMNVKYMFLNTHESMNLVFNITSNLSLLISIILPFVNICYYDSQLGQSTSYERLYQFGLNILEKAIIDCPPKWTPYPDLINDWFFLLPFSIGILFWILYHKNQIVS